LFSKFFIPGIVTRLTFVTLSWALILKLAFLGKNLAKTYKKSEKKELLRQNMMFFGEN
jgi:hypothetical protein